MSMEDAAVIIQAGQTGGRGALCAQFQHILVKDLEPGQREPFDVRIFPSGWLVALGGRSRNCEAEQAQNGQDSTKQFEK